MRRYAYWNPNQSQVILIRHIASMENFQVRERSFSTKSLFAAGYESHESHVIILKML